MFKNGVTPIEKIIDLDDMENQDRLQMNEKINQKFIRNTGDKGGMLNYEKMYHIDKQNQPHTQLHKQPHTPLYIEQPLPIQKDNRTEQLEEDFIYPRKNYMHYSCIDISNHTKHCPVCSRLYYNDKNAYVVVIGILIILCILLAKKCMEK